MKKLIIKFTCLDGDYCFTLDNGAFLVETNITYLANKNGVIENYDEIVSKINELNLYNWDTESESHTFNIEDAVKWHIQIDDYIISGIEGSWPYRYDSLIDILVFLDQNISIFKANISNE